MEYFDRACQARILAEGGQLVGLLETRLAQFHQVEHCVAFNSGFWALAVLLRLLARPGRAEVVMPALTYRRMSDIAAWAGLKPRFCEVDPQSLTNGAAQVAACLGEETALIIGVHPICGLADVDGLSQLSRDFELPLVFDSVESAYESHGGQRIGGFGEAEIFSLGASKLINGFEGGYVTTRHGRVARSLRQRLSAWGPPGNDRKFTFNANLNEAHAAMALASLDDLESQIIRNRTRYHAYRDGLAALHGMRLIEYDEGSPPGYKNILVEVLPEWPLSRDNTIRVLNAEMALARAYYPQPLHGRPMEYPHVPADLPTTNALAGRFLLLPCGELVGTEDVDSIIALLVFMSAHAGAVTAGLTSLDAAHGH